MRRCRFSFARQSLEGIAFPGRAWERESRVAASRTSLVNLQLCALNYVKQSLERGVPKRSLGTRKMGDCMIVLEKSADAYSLRDADFELSYRYLGDRWQHGISVQHDGQWRPLLTSQEGSATDDVPPSPPLQDLRFEQLADGVFEFQLLGQSGKGVYSAAVRF